MGKFKFRLSTLLRLREVARDERRTELAQAYRADEIVEQEQQRVAQELADLKKEGREASSPGQLDVDRLLEARRYELVLQAQRQHAAGQRQAVQAEIERRRRALVEANRGVRVLETLREKQHQRHQEHENRQQVKQLDEMAGRAVRREGQG